MDEGKKTVWDVLNSIVINVNVDERADCADKKYFEILNEGRKQNDITKIYEFIDAAERGGMNPRCSSEIITFFEEAYREKGEGLLFCVGSLYLVGEIKAYIARR